MENEGADFRPGDLFKPLRPVCADALHVAPERRAGAHGLKNHRAGHPQLHHQGGGGQNPRRGDGRQNPRPAFGAEQSISPTDGGFGKDNSNILSTYYALEALNTINNSVIPSKTSIFDFINDCRTDNGIFTSTPQSYPPYIEGIYAGIKTCEILEVKPGGINNITNFVLQLQNNDYGFRRSKYIGISELEYTFKALSVLKTLSYFQK